jgi:(p)ppGpp synthase/HD superfamily hydrolase
MNGMTNVYKAPAPLPEDLTPEAMDNYSINALSVMVDAHAGQKRKNSGLPYGTHPQAVADSLMDKRAVPVGLLHDVLEDSGDKYPESRLRQLFPAWIVDRVVILSRQPGQEYVDYVLMTAIDPITSSVKQADLMHNISDLKPGSLRDKYLLAAKVIKMYQVLAEANRYVEMNKSDWGSTTGQLRLSVADQLRQSIETVTWPGA